MRITKILLLFLLHLFRLLTYNIYVYYTYLRDRGKVTRIQIANLETARVGQWLALSHHKKTLPVLNPLASWGPSSFSAVNSITPATCLAWVMVLASKPAGKHCRFPSHKEFVHLHNQLLDFTFHLQILFIFPVYLKNTICNKALKLNACSHIHKGCYIA